MKSKFHFKALLTYISAEESGKTTPVSSGFRAVIRFSFEQDNFIGIQDFLETELVFPGDIVVAAITLLNPNPSMENLYNGQDFDFFEGDVLIGHGTITKI